MSDEKEETVPEKDLEPEETKPSPDELPSPTRLQSAELHEPETSAVVASPVIPTVDNEESDTKPASIPPLESTRSAVPTDSKAAIRRERRNGPHTVTPGAVAVARGGAAAATQPNPPALKSPTAASIKAAMREERQAHGAQTVPGAVSVASSSARRIDAKGSHSGVARPTRPNESDQTVIPGARPMTAAEERRKMSKAGSASLAMSPSRAGEDRGERPTGHDQGTQAADHLGAQPAIDIESATKVLKMVDASGDIVGHSSYTKMDEAKGGSVHAGPNSTPGSKHIFPDEGSRPSGGDLRTSSKSGGEEKYELDSGTFDPNQKQKQSSMSDNVQRVSQKEADNGVVTAQVIDEDELEAEYQAKMMREIVTADVFDVEELKETGRCWKMSAAVICIIGVVLAIAIPLSKDDGAAVQPTPSPTVQSPSDYLYDLVFPFSGSALDDPTSPQYRAFNWLLFDDPAQLAIKETNDTLLMERYAASVFYYSTDGENWLDSVGFLTNTSVCTWRSKDDVNGFKCLDGIDEVVKLDMTDNNLNGTLPVELLMFSRLSSLSFIKGNLRGTIPSEIGEMSALTFLQLADHQLSGTIPNSLKNLRFTLLNILSNKFVGTIPNDMFLEMKDLQYLLIGDNDFEGPLPNLNRQSQIEYLFAFNNSFEGPIPASYFQQNKLTFLILSKNQLTGTIPEQIRALTKLEVFQGQQNRFTGSIPAALSELSSLQEFTFYDNALSGTLPAQLARSTSLATFNVARNQIKGSLPSEFGDLRALGLLNFSFNALSGTVPSSFSQLTKLASFDVSGTNIQGGMETSFCSQATLITNIKADCLGDNSTNPCSCCAACCTAGENCDTNVPAVCEVRRAVYESKPDRGTSCECINDGTRLNCLDSCETCNLTGSICLQSTDYGTVFDEVSGEPLKFSNTMQYTVGRNDTLLFSQEKGADICELFVNGEKCQFCALSLCSSGSVGYEISCTNIGGPSVRTCSEKPESVGYLEAFYLADPGSLTGCVPVLSDYTTQTGFVPG